MIAKKSSLKVIKLYSNISPSACDLGSKYFISLGNFQFMTFDIVKNFQDIFKYQRDEKLAGGQYAVHPIHFIDIGDGYDELPFSQKHTNNVHMVNTLALNRCSDILKHDGYLNRDDLFGEIKVKVEQIASGFGVKAQVYAGIGSADIIVISESPDINLHASLFSEIRTIKSEKAVGVPFFKSSNTFFVVHYDFELMNIKNNDNCRVALRYELKDLNSSAELFGMLKKILDFDKANGKASDTKPSRHSYTYRFGDYDVSLYLNSPDMAKLLYLWGVRGRGSTALFSDLGEEAEKFKEAVKEYEKFSEVYISRSQRRLINNFNDPKVKVHEGYENQEDLISREINGDNLSDNIRNKTKRWRLKIGELEGLKHDIRFIVPAYAEHTLDFLVNKCVKMLFSEKKRVSGLRMYALLRCAMLLIKKMNPNGDIVIKTLGTLSAALNNLLLADTLGYEHMDIYDPETIGPTIKLFHAYEHMIERVHSALNQNSGDMDTLFFLTINPDGGIYSYDFLPDYSSFGSKFHSINLPNVSYFEPKRSVIYIAHELGHYVNTVRFDDPLEIPEGLMLRNKALRKMLESYAKVYCWNVLQGVVPENMGNEYQLFFDYFVCEARKAFNFNYAFPAATFAQECVEYLDFLWRAAVKNKDLIVSIDNDKNGGYSNETSPKNRIFYTSFCLALKTLSLSKTAPIGLLRDTIREVRADILMCRICNLDYKRYISAHLQNIRSSKTKQTQLDMVYIMRLAAVLSTLLVCDEPDNENTIDKYRFTLDEEESVFLESILTYKKQNEELLEPLVSYLRYVWDYAVEKLDSEAVADDVKKILKIFREPDLDTALIYDLHREWYNNLRKWGTELDEH